MRNDGPYRWKNNEPRAGENISYITAEREREKENQHHPVKMCFQEIFVAIDRRAEV